MKKLMFIAALLCAGMATQAAVVEWTVQYKNATVAWQNGAPAAGSIVYAFLASDLSTVQTALGGKTAADVASNFAGLQVLNNSKNTMGPFGVLTGGKIDSESLVDAQAYDLILVAFNAATIGDATEYLISGSQSATAYTALTPGNKSVATWDNVNRVTGTWTTIGNTGVPEPTSGLLLVLGGAMLALRRRRA